MQTSDTVLRFRQLPPSRPSSKPTLGRKVCFVCCISKWPGCVDGSNQTESLAIRNENLWLLWIHSVVFFSTVRGFWFVSCRQCLRSTKRTTATHAGCLEVLQELRCCVPRSSDSRKKKKKKNLQLKRNANAGNGVINGNKRSSLVRIYFHPK